MIILHNTEQNNSDYHFRHECATLITREYCELQNSMNKLKCPEYVRFQYSSSLQSLCKSFQKIIEEDSS